MVKVGLNKPLLESCLITGGGGVLGEVTTHVPGIPLGEGPGEGNQMELL